MGCMTKSKTKVVVLVYHFRWYCCWFCVCVFVFVSKTPLELWAIFHWNRKWIEFVFAGGLRVPLLLTLSSSLGCRCLHWKQRKADVRRHGDSHLSAVFGLLEIGPCHWPFLPRVAPKAVRVLACCLSSASVVVSSARGKTSVKEKLLLHSSWTLFECNYWWRWLGIRKVSRWWQENCRKFDGAIRSILLF